MTTTPAPLGAPSTPHADPTAVLGKRFVAYVIDAVVLVALVVGVAMALWEHSEITEGFDDGEAYCDALVDTTDFGGQCIAVPADTPLLGDYVYLVETSDQVIQSIVPIAWVIANLVLLQGLTGASVGKLITGLRVVNPSGDKAGIRSSAIRTVLWVVDAAPWIFPLVGLVTALTTNGHRRVGDMVASTYVVGRSSVGVPIHPVAVEPPTDQTAWGAAPMQDPAQPENVPETQPPEAQPPETQPREAQPEPQWDEARNAYLQWDPGQNAWLQWDDVGGRWKPIDS